MKRKKVKLIKVSVDFYTEREAILFLEELLRSGCDFLPLIRPFKTNGQTNYVIVREFREGDITDVKLLEQDIEGIHCYEDYLFAGRYSKITS
ncbi:MAG: hypothetical protein EPO24_03310 [Bacteroidetes bacterium]|nr:MAG: hypothetical protein EPO24_03310 [Bacteroidota bacterium]